MMILCIASYLASFVALMAPPTTTGNGPVHDQLHVQQAIRIGGAGDDRLEGVVVAENGEIYIVGSLGDDSPLTGVPTLVFKGRSTSSEHFTIGFVARLDRDGKLLSAARMPLGVGELNSVAIDRAGNVLVGGYATSALEPAMTSLPGLLRTFPSERMTVQTHTPREHTELSNPQPDRSPQAAPVVLKLNAELSGLLAATYLDGRKTVWHVPAPLDEDMSQPTGIVPLPDGDVLVCHDGGPIVPPAPGEKPTHFHFYFAEDRVSRLSTNLDARRWRVELRSPPIDPARASKTLGAPWRHDTMGNARTLRFRSDGADGAYLAGFAPSRTSAEPWWAPFLFRVDGRGKLSVAAYTFDPTSGKDARLNGLVSDSGIRSVRVSADGSVLLTTIGDGGNSVLRRDPRDYTRETSRLKGSAHGFRGRTLFWGTVVRLDGKSMELLNGNTLIGYHRNIAEPAWAEDIVDLPDGSVLAVGRHRRGFGLRDAGEPFFLASRRAPEVDANAPAPARYQVQRDSWGGFVAVFDRDMNARFIGSVDGACFRECARRGERVAVVGTAVQGRGEPSGTRRIGPGGKTDGLILLLDVATP